MGSYLLNLYPSCSRLLPIKGRLSSCFPMVIKRYNSRPSKENSNGHGMERATSTAEEFERVAEEFERVKEAKARQGFASQTIEKGHDGTEEAAVGESKVKSVKEKYKEHVGKGKFHKTGNEWNPQN